MDLTSIWIMTGGALIALMVLLRLFAPDLYDRYVLRGKPHASGKASDAVAVIMLLGLIAVGVHLYVTNPDQKPAVQKPLALHTPGKRFESGIGLLFVLVVGISLWIFPVRVLTKFSNGTINISRVDEAGKKKIKLFGRLLGSVFLLAAVLLARQLM